MARDGMWNKSIGPSENSLIGKSQQHSPDISVLQVTILFPGEKCTFKMTLELKTS
jgi:hypothetical protein